MNLKSFAANRIKQVLILVTIILFCQCKNKPETYGDVLSKHYDQKVYAQFDSTAYYKVYAKVYDQVKDRLHNPNWMKQISDSTTGLTLMSDHLMNGELDSLLVYLQQLPEHGINPQLAHTTEIQQNLDKIRQNSFTNIEDVYHTFASLNLFATDAFIFYMNGMKNGFTNPKKLYGRYFVKNHRMNLKEATQLLDSVAVVDKIKSVLPKNRFYIKFQQLATQSQVSKVTKTKIYMTMEKLRWMGKDFPEEYVFVNIPEQYLHVFQHDEDVLSMKVCVGATANSGYSKNGENHETPVMDGMLDNMQVNPVWNIPNSIVQKELLNSVRNNPHYLQSRNMVAYYKGKMVDPLTTDWNADSVKYFKFKQNPGNDNSLGNIKFLFNNPYSIYLHDTPSKYAFDLTNRAVSHGCVRVEKPKELAAFLVNNEAQAQRIAQEIDDTSNTSRWVSLKKKVPVFLSYYTTWLNDQDELVQFADIYGYDNRLEKALKNIMLK